MLNYWYIYYLEVRNRFLLLFVCWICVAATCYFYKETLLFLFVSFSNYAAIPTLEPYFIFTDVTEIFSVYVQLTFFLSNQITLIKFCYHSLMFLSLGLYAFEYINLKSTFEILLVSWGVSVVLLNEILVPLSWKFFLSFRDETNLKTISLFFEAKLHEYFDFYTNLYYMCLLNSLFLIFIVSFVNNLSRDLERIKSFRKIIYFISVVFSTLITPPDVLSQLLISFILILIYEVLILINIFGQTSSEAN